MIPYKTLTKFYEGDDKTQRTVLSSSFLNSIINQIEYDLNNLDDRVIEIEKVFSDNTLSIDTIYSKNNFLDNIDATTANITSLTSTESALQKITSDEIISEKISSAELSTTNFFSTNLTSSVALLNSANIGVLKTDEFQISDNYVFKPEYIEFNTEGVGSLYKVKDDNSNGVLFEYVTDDANVYGSLKLKNENGVNTLTLELDSNSPYDNLVLKSNNRLILDSENVIIKKINTEIDDSYIGTLENPIYEINAQRIVGHFYSRTEADVAEVYETDKKYEPGTLLQVGEEVEGTIYNGGVVLGIVSDSYAILLNEEFKNTKKFTSEIALVGRIFAKISNEIKRGLYVEPDEKNPGMCKTSNKKTIYSIGVVIDEDKSIIKLF